MTGYAQYHSTFDVQISTNYIIVQRCMEMETQNILMFSQSNTIFCHAIIPLPKIAMNVISVIDCSECTFEKNISL